MTDIRLVQLIFQAIGSILSQVPRPDGHLIRWEVEEDPDTGELLIALGIRVNDQDVVEAVPEALDKVTDVAIQPDVWN